MMLVVSKIWTFLNFIDVTLMPSYKWIIWFSMMKIRFDLMCTWILAYGILFTRVWSNRNQSRDCKFHKNFKVQNHFWHSLIHITCDLFWFFKNVFDSLGVTYNYSKIKTARRPMKKFHQNALRVIWIRLFKILNGKTLNLIGIVRLGWSEGC